jgi:purine catabolism regulator
MAPGETRITVAEVWPLALPAGTTLAGGQDGLARAVEWVTALRASFPLFGDLSEGYLALANLELARGLDSRVTPDHLISELHRAGAAGLVVDEAISSSEAALADDLALPVFILPQGTSIHLVERDILRTLVDREGQMARREVEAGQRLKQIFGRGGIKAVLGELARLVGADVIVVDGEGEVVSRAEGPAATQCAAETAFPIEVAGKVLGRLVLRVRPDGSNALQTVYARQTAEICGIEMLQQRTRQETEERLGLDLIDQLLDENHDEKVIAARLLRLGYDMADERRHVVVALGAMSEQNQYVVCHDVAREMQRAAQRDGATVVMANYHSQFLLFCSIAPNTAERRVRDWLHSALTNRSGQECSVGVSRVVRSLAGLCGAVRQALDAWELGRHIAGLESPYFYEQMGLYRLLAELRGRDELARFYDETLGELARYDREHNTELVHTLEAFFEGNANASQTSRALYVHRNTLNYRLQRIVEITGLDLNDAEARLAFQLALKIHHLSS